MKHNKVLLSLLAVFMCLLAYSRPAHRGVVVLAQPDGSTFRAILKGDEFVRIKMTEDGHAIAQDNEGWWCYASYAGDGRKLISAHRVGSQCPPQVISESRNIPYRMLSQLASAKKHSLPIDDEVPVLERMRSAKVLSTRADGDEPQQLVKHGIVILAQFANLGFKHTREDFERMLMMDGYSLNGATGSAREYFDAQFGGKVSFQFDVSEIVTLGRDLAQYGGNVSSSAGVESDRAAADMIYEACELADATVDFAKYDDDGDGEVDNVFVFFAGGDEAEGAGDDCIWSHAWYLRDGAGKSLVLDGKLIDRYACTAEMTRYATSSEGIGQRLAGIGTFCHEYAHTFGLADMYDTDYEGSGGESEALWDHTSLMDGGNQNNSGNTPPFFNAIEREMLGMQTPVMLDADGKYRMQPIHKGGTYYRMNTDTDEEYYLFECRSNDSWDKYIGGKGMLVYHIDKSFRLAGYSDSYGMDLKARQRWNYYNEVNCRPDHQCADLIEAMPGASSVKGVFYPAGGIDSIPAERLAYWSGLTSVMSFNDITMEGDDVSFSVTGNDIATTPPVPVLLAYEKFQDAAIVTFESDRKYNGEATILWGKTGKENSSLTLKPYAPGKYALLLEGLDPKTSYTVLISFSMNGIVGKEGAVSFLTNTDNGGYPYIYLKNVLRNPDGTFPSGSRLPLRVYNTVKAVQVSWYLNGTRIKTDAQGYYTLTEGGTLKAVVTWDDGTEDVICKEIRISE